MKPKQANVDGKKVEKLTHTVQHTINWSYLALGLGLIVVGWALASGRLGSKNQTNEMRKEVRESRD